MTPPVGTKCQDTCKRPTQTQAHCSVCHLTFRSVTSFDKHRKNGYCVMDKMVEHSGIWQFNDGRERLPAQWRATK